MIRTSTAAVAMTIGCAITTSAQQLVPVTGRVLDDVGAPVAGARVHLSRRIANDLVPAAHVVATTDALGRFSVRLEAGADHSAFAVHGDGTRCSSLLENVAVDRPLELRLCRATARLRIAVDGLAEWATIGPFRIEASPAAANPFWTPLRDQGLPPIPWPVWLQIVDADNQVLHRFALSPDTSSRIPPPRSFDLNVVDQDGRPIANATVAHQVPALPAPGTAFAEPAPTSWRITATTDAAGDVRVAIPDPMLLPMRPRTMLRVAAPGRGPVLLWVDGLTLCPRPNGLMQGEPVPVVLEPSGRLRVRRRGTAVAGATVRLWAHGFGGNRVTEFIQATTDQDGRLPIALPAAATECLLRVDIGTEPPAFLRIPPWKSGETLTADLTGSRAADWQLLDENARPLGGIPCAFFVCGSGMAPDLPMLLRTDAEGRFRCSLGADRWLLVCRDGGRAVTVDIGDAETLPKIGSATLVVRPLPRAQVVVRPGANAAAAGIAFVATADSYYDAIAQHESNTLRREVARRSDRRFIDQQAPTTDASGRVSIPLLSEGADGPSVAVVKGRATIGPWQLQRDREVAVDLGR